MPLHKYACHIVHMCSTALHCTLHIDPTILYIGVKNNKLQLFVYHAIATHVPTTNMPLKCHI